MAARFVLALSCPDRPGIIRAVAGHLADAGCNVVDSQQFADPLTRRFFLRAEADAPEGLDLQTLRGSFAAVGRNFGMEWALHDATARPRLLILVSTAGHCLNDLLFRWESGALPAEVAGVVSNHTDLEPLATRHGVPFHHVPVPPGGKPGAEKALLDLVAAERVTSSCWPATCRCSPTGSAPSWPGGRSTSTTRSCPRSPAPGRTTKAYERGV